MATINSRQSGMTLEIRKNNARQQTINQQEHYPGPKKKTRRTCHLTDSEIEKFRSRLLVKRNDILNTVSGIKSEISTAKSNDAGPMDVADMAALNHTIEEDYKLLESERCVLDEIDKSLERIQEGTYGLCQECMEQIPKRRLQAIPWARYCVLCASEMQSWEQATNDKERQKWAEKHASRLQRLFKQWQKPLGIDSEEYCKHAMKEFLNYYDDPLRKSLTESLY